MGQSSGAVSRAGIVGLGVPVLACGAGVAVQVAIMDQLPPDVATHWSASGPDGFSSPGFVPVMTLLVAGLLPLILGVSPLRSVARGDRGFALALLPGVAAGLGVFLSILLTGSLLMQRGLASGTLAPDVDGLILGALVAGLVVGVLGWLVQDRGETVRRELGPVGSVERRAGERVVWLGRAEMSGAMLLTVVLATVSVGIAAIMMWVWADAIAAWIVTGVSVLLVALLATFTSFEVRVDASGLSVTSAARVVRMHVPAVDTVDVAVIDVRGLAQFGGFGIRHVPGATAVILRSGPALEVTREGGRRFVVTLDRPEDAAAVLAAVAEDARAAQD